MRYYKKYLTDKNFLLAFFGGLLLVTLSLILQYYATSYATLSSSQSVTDIILSNTRVYDVDGIFVYGTVLLTFITIFIGFWRLNYAPFILKSIAIFTTIRAVFLSLTHISPFPTRVAITSTFFQHSMFNGIFTGNDLFFSGHTGLPFLFALIFWEHKPLRYMFLGFSVVFAVVVLLGHLHYSIDVLSAYFISYAIFDICKFLFKKDWKLFNSELKHETL